MEVQEQFGDQVQFVGVGGLSDTDSINAFISETGVDAFPQVIDEAGSIWDAFGVTEQRTYVYLDDSGEWERSGYGSLAEDVQALIAN